MEVHLLLGKNLLGQSRNVLPMFVKTFACIVFSFSEEEISIVLIYCFGKDFHLSEVIFLIPYIPCQSKVCN